MDDDQHNPEETPNPDGEDTTEHGETVSIQWRNLEFTVPKNRLDWDMNVQFEFEDGRRVRALFILLGGNGADGLRAVRAQVYEVAKSSRELDEFLQHVSTVLEKECVGNLP